MREDDRSASREGTLVAAHEAIREGIAGAEPVGLPDALDFSNVEQADAFNAALSGFLGRH